MERQEVRNKDGELSSGVKSVGYDPVTQTLEVEFPSGGVYEYAAVPQDVYDRFMAAESKGRFFAADVRACFESKNLNPKPKKEETHGEKGKTEAKPGKKDKKGHAKPEAKARKRIS